jgi:hypothetical protein
MNIPGRESVGVIKIVDDRSGIMDLEEGVEFIGLKGFRKHKEG